METISMSGRERKRLVALGRVVSGELSLSAAELGMGGRAANGKPRAAAETAPCHNSPGSRLQNGRATHDAHGPSPWHTFHKSVDHATPPMGNHSNDWGRVVVWDRTSGEQIASKSGMGEVFLVGFSADGKTVKNLAGPEGGK